MVSRIQRLRRSSFTPVVSLILLLSPPARSAADLAHVRNFGRVDDNLYRGAEPSSVALEELQHLGVRLVIDLREKGLATAREQREADRLQMRYINVPLPAWSAPSPSDVQRLLTMLDTRAGTSIFVHCRRGKDRTGTIIACYRIEHDHWSSARAQAEANSYGMSNAERAMRSFIAHFTPATTVP